MELGGEYAAMWNIQVQEREKMLEMEAVRLLFFAAQNCPFFFSPSGLHAFTYHNISTSLALLRAFH